MGSIYSDLKDSLDSIYRVSERHKKSMIKAMETLKNISNSYRASDVIRMLDYTAELTLTLPKQTMFNLERPSVKPITVTSKELIRGHQDFEEYIKRNRNARFSNKVHYITADYSEKYSQEISKYIKVALLLDTDDEVIYIVLYVNEKEIFRKKYTELVYKWYVKDGSKRLSDYGLNCRLLSSVEIGWSNRDWVNPVASIGGTVLEAAGTVGEVLPPLLGHPLDAIYAPLASVVKKGAFCFEHAGVAIGTMADAKDFSRDLVGNGDFELYYGSTDKGYGGIFDGKTYKKKVW